MQLGRGRVLGIGGGSLLVCLFCKKSEHTRYKWALGCSSPETAGLESVSVFCTLGGLNSGILYSALWIHSRRDPGNTEKMVGGETQDLSWLLFPGPREMDEEASNWTILRRLSPKK